MGLFGSSGADKLDQAVAAVSANPAITSAELATLLGMRHPSMAVFYRLRAIEIINNSGNTSSPVAPLLQQKRGITMRFNPFKGRQRDQQPAAPVSTPVSAPVSNGNTATNAPSKADTSQLNLVNYTPEQLMQQVHTDLAEVDLAAPWPVRFKESFGEIWSVIGPILLFAGTAGEVFFFIWNNISDTSAWWVGLSVLVTVAVLECTFMVVSYQSDTMRNRMKTKPGGVTDEDKKDLLNHKVFWFILAVGVGVGQIAFLVVGMSAKLNNLNFLVLFSVGRSAFTLAGDFYTAFIHSEKPTSGERLKARNKQRADLTNDLLKQKSAEVSLINDGVLDLRKKHTEAVMRDEADKTELEMKRLENKSRIEARKILDDQARMFTNLGNGMMQALFDPKMDERERQKLLGVMQGFMSAAKYLPQTIVTEVKDDGEERGL